ncbi:sodium/potassium/calcium exchanger 1-like isoform X1 [Lytechinus variegatus]|uniref:sodium/potassium/calcium exchanger 1-like isoform X1 n=2 Tax=Lytechinus variegatus TaxID=7654 RepID=UPI001BB2246B|nr:sodium/potassium/calcium exchanger 1-like isoform X1 [Lytechinus variegatus]
MKGNEHSIRAMQPQEVAVRPRPVRRSGRLRKPPWRHRVGLGGRDQSNIGTLNKPWLSRTSILVAFFLVSSILYITSNRESDTLRGKYDSDGYVGRSLLANVSSGGHHKPPWETCEYEAANLPVLWVVLYAVFVIILFIAIAIICDDFFVPSLEVISETLSLSEDVAGATFMAAGSSAPELFTSVIGVAFQSDVGVGTIVGSAVFNILIIIALTAALAGQVLNLDWRPLIRDSFFYGMSLVCFIVFCWDTEFTWWEALILLILYIIYLVLMKVNPTIMEKTKHITCGGFCRNEVAPLDAEAGEAGGEAPVQTVTDGPENTGQNGTANGTPLPRKLPPIQTSNLTDENRKISVLSNQSLAVPGNKHIFHHVKHGELSSNFTSSSYDLKKLARDTDSRLGSVSRPNSAHSTALSSRPDSKASFVNINYNKNNVAMNGDVNANNNNIPMVTKTNGSVVPTVVANDGRTNVHDDLVVGDVESIGGDSQGDFGSQTQLLSVPKGNVISRDNDSGIHSAHGTTPVVPVDSSSDPSCDPSYDSSDPKRRQSLVDGLHHHHHHHHEHHHDGEHKPHDTQGEKEGEEDKKSEGSEEEPTLRPFPCLPAINMYYPDREILDSTCGCLRYGLKWLLFVISFPFMCAFTWTIPNCSVPHLRKWYVASFILSIVWIAALSFGMVTLVAKMGCILKISDYTMGLVIVAVGTSVPDALSSILVARDGYGDMAVSNAIGSNVFDINLGIGLPYLIRIAINGGTNIALLNAEDQLRFDSGAFGPMPPHAKFGFILLLILLLTIVAFTAVRFRLNAIIGVSFALMYVLFMVYAFVQEIVCDGGC